MLQLVILYEEILEALTYFKISHGENLWKKLETKLKDLRNDGDDEFFNVNFQHLENLDIFSSS